MFLVAEYCNWLMCGPGGLNQTVTVVITGLGADFTRLESFGKVDAFAENLVRVHSHIYIHLLLYVSCPCFYISKTLNFTARTMLHGKM